MSEVKLLIEVGQKFLSNGKPGVIISTTIDDVPYTVAWLADDGSLVCYFTADGCYSAVRREHHCDLKPLPVAITEGVEFSGPEYAERFKELVEAGREFEVFRDGDFVKSSGTFFESAVYFLRSVPQHTDANGNALKVGDRVEGGGSRFTVTGLSEKFVNNGDYIIAKSSCHKLTTRTRPLCAADLMQHRTAIFQHSVGLRCYPLGLFDESEVRIGDLNVSYDDLQKHYDWSPSSDQPWQPCEVEEEVLA